MIYDFICTYHLIDDIHDSNLLYQIQLLQAFELNIFDDIKIENELEILFNKIFNYTQINNIINFIKKKHNLYIVSDIIAFKILFNYDYFYIFFKCLQELFINNYITENSYNKLINLLTN
jgi:hypothetical protein